MIHCKLVNKHKDFTKYILFKHYVFIHTQSLRNDCLLELVGPLELTDDTIAHLYSLTVC